MLKLFVPKVNKSSISKSKLSLLCINFTLLLFNNFLTSETDYAITHAVKINTNIISTTTSENIPNKIVEKFLAIAFYSLLVIK